MAAAPARRCSDVPMRPLGHVLNRSALHPVDIVKVSEPNADICSAPSGASSFAAGSFGSFEQGTIDYDWR